MAIHYGSGGITFTGTNTPAQSAGTGTSNVLDDYEEGTWVSAYAATSCTFTMSASAGYYTKFGRVQHLSYICVTNGVSLNGANAMTITGVPFTTQAASLIASAPVAFNANFPGGGAQFVYIGSNSNALAMYFGAGWDSAAYNLTSPKTATGMGNAANNNYCAGIISLAVNA
jgi:hypothetical protein